MRHKEFIITDSSASQQVVSLHYKEMTFLTIVMDYNDD